MPKSSKLVKTASSARKLVRGPQSREPVALRRASKGKRAQFYENQAVDQLFAVVTALAAEVSVVVDRLDTLERVLVAARIIPADSVETYIPTAAEAEVRSRRREELIQRAFAVFDAYGAAQGR